MLEMSDDSSTKAGRAMLRRQAEAVIREPDGRGTPKMPADGHASRCQAGTTSHRGPFRRGTNLLALFGDGRQSYSAPESASAGRLSGECRLKPAPARRSS